MFYTNKNTAAIGKYDAKGLTLRMHEKASLRTHINAYGRGEACELRHVKGKDNYGC